MNDELVVAVCGPVDAGKSSLIGVLTSGQLDNGRGDARLKILRHPHEQDSGRTSNISMNPIKYILKETKQLEIYNTKAKKNTEIKKLKEISLLNDGNLKEKVISFMDLAGHEKYLKTTVFGVTGMFPDRGIVVIGANTGITKLTREHLGILLYLKIPFIITITKIDLAPVEIYQKLCNRIKILLTKASFGKIIYNISSGENRDIETIKYINDMIDNPDIIPVISISNKTGTNIDNLHKILYRTPQRNKWKDDKSKTVVYLDTNYSVPGIGLVLSGTIKGNSVKVKQKMYLGPFAGEFYPIMIRSIHNTIREDVNELTNNHQGCFSIKFLNSKQTLTRNQIKKGMVLIDSIDNWKCNIISEFKAKIKVLHHSSTITTGYSPIIHCGPIRQPARINIDNNDKEYLKSNDDAIVTFTFMKNKEFIEKDMIFFFRDGGTKGVGEVIAL